MGKEFTFKVKVYYEDTDAGGIVYYANYLKFLERARSEAIYLLGFSNKKLLDEFGSLIIVKSCNIKYFKPAKLEEVLNVISNIKIITQTSFIMNQIIKRNDETITEAEVHLVVVNSEGRPIKIPNIFESKLKEYL